MADQLPKTCSLHIQHEGTGHPMGRLLSPPALRGPGCQLHTGIFRHHVGETTSSTSDPAQAWADLSLQHMAGKSDQPLHRSPHSFRLLAVHAVGFSFIYPTAHPSSSSNSWHPFEFHPPNLAVDPQHCRRLQWGPTHTSLWGRCPHGSRWVLLVHYKQPISGAVFVPGKLAYEFCSCSLQGQPKPPLTQTLEGHQQSTHQEKLLSPCPGLFPYFLTM